MGMAMGSGGDQEQKGNDEEEEAVGEVGVEMGKEHGFASSCGCATGG
jgi:hypothetical protein